MVVFERRNAHDASARVCSDHPVDGKQMNITHVAIEDNHTIWANIARTLSGFIIRTG